MPYRVRGISNLLYTDEEMSVAGLTADGQHLQAWVTKPAGKVWEPHDRDPLLWLPPSATKATDVDQAGSIVDVLWGPGEDRAWVTAQVEKHNRYLDVLRERVRAGTLKLTAFLAKMLGLPFEDGVELMPFTAPAFRATTGTYKAASDLQAMIDATGPARPTIDVKAIAAKAAEQLAETGDLPAALDGIFRAVRGQSAPIDPE